MTMPIEAVVFDLFGTLVPSFPSSLFERSLEKMAAVGMQAVLIAPPGEVSPDTSENEGETWTGPRIEALSDVLSLLNPPSID